MAHDHPPGEHPFAEEQSASRRRRLTDEARTRHDALTSAIEQLERALASAAASRAAEWARRVSGDLETVGREVAAHVESIEVECGLFDEIAVSEPRLAERTAGLREEHEQLVARAAKLADDVRRPGDVDVVGLRRDAAALLGDLRAHRAAEADLVYEAFWIDLGVGD